MSNFYEKVYAIVRLIPRGKVTSYGRIARMLSAPRASRAVGYALNGLKDKHEDARYKDIPWQRVVNGQGRISIVNREYGAEYQAKRLREEGVAVNEQFKLPAFEADLWVGLEWPEVALIVAELEKKEQEDE